MASIHVSAGKFNPNGKEVEFKATDKKVLKLGKQHFIDKKTQTNSVREVENVNNQMKNNVQIPPRNIEEKEEPDKEPIGGDDMII